MDVNQLRYFVTVAETLNFTEAARRHFISQPAISSQISALEQALQVRLFHRSSHEVRLTDAGRAFWAEATEILQRLESAQARVRNIAEGQVGRISVAALGTAPKKLGRCLSAFYRQCPKVQVDIGFHNGREIMLAMQEHTADFYFAVEGLLPSQHDLEYLTIDRSPYCLVVPAAEAGRIDPSDLSNLKGRPFIATARAEGPVLHDQVLQICRALNYIPEVVNIYNRADPVLISVAAGMGVSVLPASIIENWPRDEIAVIPLDTPLRMVSILARHTDSSAPAAQRFWETVQTLFPSVPLDTGAAFP